MCFGAGDDQADEARRERKRLQKEEKARKRRITQGQSAIDSAFSQFDDGYFNNYQDAYRGYYTPELEKQYGEARGKLIAALAGRGMLGSSMGGSRIADLTNKYQDERVAVGARAMDAANELRSRVEGQRDSLYSMNNASADPSTAATRASAAATTLSAPQSYSPLGQVFASALQPIGAYISADRNSVNPRLPFNQVQQSYVSPAGSGRVIR